MHKIAVVFGFSESCYELARQLIVSCQQAADLSLLDASYHFIAYECNYNMKKRASNPFIKELELQSDTPIDAEVIQIQEELRMDTPLPDMAVYHHFALNHMDQYDYVLFCHDDVYMKRNPVFKELVTIIDSPNTDLIAEASVTCTWDLSIRFRPSFIFVRTDKFRRANLSFLNEHILLRDSVLAYPMYIDGGAGLLASYYHKAKPIKCIPFTKFPSTWYKHLRFDTDYGVEMYNLINPNGPQFDNLIRKARKYSDYFLYGKKSSN